jgi:hypothetical protein
MWCGTFGSHDIQEITHATRNYLPSQVGLCCMEFFFLPNPYILMVIKKKETSSSTRISNSLSVLWFSNIIMTSWLHLKLFGTLFQITLKQQLILKC